MAKNKIKKEISDPPLEERVENSIKNTEETTQTIFSDLDEVGLVVDQIKAEMKKNTELTQQLQDKQEKFKKEIAIIIKQEIEKQIKPLADQLGKMTKSKPKFIYIRPKFNLFGFLKKK